MSPAYASVAVSLGSISGALIWPFVQARPRNRELFYLHYASCDLYSQLTFAAGPTSQLFTAFSSCYSLTANSKFYCSSASPTTPDPSDPSSLRCSGSRPGHARGARPRPSIIPWSCPSALRGAGLEPCVFLCFLILCVIVDSFQSSGSSSVLGGTVMPV